MKKGDFDRKNCCCAELFVHCLLVMDRTVVFKNIQKCLTKINLHRELVHWDIWYQLMTNVIFVVC